MPSYIKQTENNGIMVYFNDVPDSAFIDATKVRDIYIATILSRSKNKNLKPGQPDVRLKSATGEVVMISRFEFCTKFRHAGGKKITLAFLRSDTPYVVVGECNKKYKIAKLPDNCLGDVNGRTVAPGSYVVCRASGNDEVMRDTMTIVSAKLFRKMFKIPLQPVIKRYMDGSGSKHLNMNNLRRKGGMPKHASEITDIAEPITTPNGLRMGVKANIPTIDINAFNKSAAMNNNNTQPKLIGADRLRKGVQQQQATQQPNAEQNNYRFRVTHRIVNMNNKNIVGFVVQEISTGRSKQMGTDQVKMMCEQKSIENMMLVTKEGTNITYLRGNGIRIEALPEVIA